MAKTKQYILNELKVIHKECATRGISADEWVERYAEGYRRKYYNENPQRKGGD